MYAVYLCGCTDCFLHAIFVTKDYAEKRAKEHSQNPEGYFIKHWATPEDIDREDTGWYNGKPT